MAVTTGTISVNGGNDDWTRADVMTALETVFGTSHLNWNSGTQQNGVPVCCLFPGHDGTSAVQYQAYSEDEAEARVFTDIDNWSRCGGPAINYTTGGGADGGTVDGKDGYSATRYLYVTNNGTSNYLVQDELIPATNSVDNSTDVITLTHRLGANLTTGTKVTYNGQGTNTAVITGLTVNTVYYMRRIGPNKITLHTSQAGANDNNNRVDVTSTSLTDAKRLRTDAVDSPTITVKRGEKLYWYDHAMNQGNFRLCDVTTTSGAYNAERVLSDSSKLSSYTTVAVSGSGTYNDPWYMDTKNYPQTETETYNPQKVSGTGHVGLFSYGYCNDAQSALKGSIVILPDVNRELYNHAYQSRHCYWKYTVPASGSRGALKLRVYRDHYTTNAGCVSGISIHNVATGWSANQAFTIPGEDIGGVATTNDITFGSNSYSGSGTNNTPSIIVTNHGAGNNMFQKHPSGDFSVLRMENHATKTFGTTYWAFGIDDNNYRMYFKSGCAWQTLNCLGTNCDTTSNYNNQYGVFGGDLGLDVQYYNVSLDRTPYTYSDEAYIDIATTSSPTDYPLKIRYFKGASPQDTNFAVIQFIQDIGGNENDFGTITLHRGSNFGANVWDLDHVWLGSYTEYKTSSSADRYVEMTYQVAAHHDTSNERPSREPADYYSLSREASYGYLRNGGSSSAETSVDVRYYPNIMTPHSTNSWHDEVITYYRDQTLDKVTSGISHHTSHLLIKDDDTNSVGTSAAYYRPIKGIPISNKLAPCPYYMPDDFVLIQAEVSPPATVFRSGDTVTVASGEVYTIIKANNQVNQTGLGGGQVAVGMIFAARTT